MISGKSMTSQEYRKMEALSASDLRLFITDRRKFFKEKVERNRDEEEDEEYNRAFLIGDLVHTILLEPNLVDSKFYMSICPSPPTGLMLDFTENLFKFTLLATDEDGEISKEFDVILTEAYQASKFKISKEAVIKKFTGSNAELYYKELREAKTNNLKVVTGGDMDIAQRIVNTLRTHKYTRDIVNEESTKDVLIFHEVQIEFELFGIEMKAMLDKIRIDIINETVEIFDYKIVWDNTKFYNEYYTFRRADIQAYVYYKAMIAIDFTERFGVDISKFTVISPVFIVADSTNFYAPILFQVTLQDLNNAEVGWSYKNNHLKGVKEILEELTWHKANGDWGEIRSLEETNGRVIINHVF